MDVRLGETNKQKQTIITQLIPAWLDKNKDLLFHGGRWGRFVVPLRRGNYQYFLPANAMFWAPLKYSSPLPSAAPSSVCWCERPLTSCRVPSSRPLPQDVCIISLAQGDSYSEKDGPVFLNNVYHPSDMRIFSRDSIFLGNSVSGFQKMLSFMLLIKFFSVPLSGPLALHSLPPSPPPVVRFRQRPSRRRSLSAWQ